MAKGAPTAVLLAALCLAGCAGSPARRLSTALKAVRSWTATARMVADHWLSGRVPTRYARATLQAALQSLERERARLASSPRTLADERVGKALPLVERVEVTLSRMWEAVDRADRARVREQAAELRAVERQIEALAAAPDSSP